MGNSPDKRYVYFVNKTRDTRLAERAFVASSFVNRLRGLLFRPPIKSGEGMFLAPCNSIHMFGMGYAIDAIFISKENRVVGLVEAIKPGSVSPIFKGAENCLELPAGTISSTATQIGDELEYGT